MVFIGIDPGLSGALVVLPLSSEARIEFHDTPILTVQSGKKLRKQMNAPAIKLMLDSILAQHGSDCMAVIEKVSAMPSFGKTKDGEEEERRTMGATSAFNFGKGVGIWIGLLAGCQIPYMEVHPATWKAALLHGMGKGKDASVVKATQLFPRTASELARKKDHGRADALMMAVYASRLRMAPGRPMAHVQPELSLF